MMKEKKNQSKYKLRWTDPYIRKQVRANNVYSIAILFLLDEEDDIHVYFLRYYDDKDLTSSTEVHKLFVFNERRFEIKKVLDAEQNKIKE